MCLYTRDRLLREVVRSGGQEAGRLEGFDQRVIETNIETPASHQLCAGNRRENGTRLIGRSVVGDDFRLDEGPCEQSTLTSRNAWTSTMRVATAMIFSLELMFA